jgi:two-component system, chemotaxis family, sensor kinase CheA
MSDFELDQDLIEVVLAEALESLESALWTLRAAEHGPQSPEVVASLFRCFHSIKGNTAMAGRTQVSKAAHRAENALEIVRAQNRALVPAEVKALIEVVDVLHPLIEGLEQSEPVWEALYGSLSALEQILATEPGVGTTQTVHRERAGVSVPVALEPQRPAPTVIVPDYQNGETSPSLQPRTTSSTGVDGEDAASGSDKVHESGGAKLKVDAQSIVDAMTVAGELFQIDERLKFFVRTATDKSKQASQEHADKWDGLTQLSREFDAAIERLYNQLLDIQRLPVAQLTGPLERCVRDICRKTGKQIDFIVRGRDLRIDKNVIQALKDPLMHMVRNASDHGAEPPEERVASGKHKTAKVILEFDDADDTVVVTLSDDGRGMDRKRILAKGIERGLVDAEKASTLSAEDIVEFIFHPGFSTAAQVSELSGRGVGMDVVAKSITGAGGHIEIRTELGQGSTFRIELPKLGSPVVDGLAVRSAEVVYLIPVKNVLCFAARSDFKLVQEPEGRLSALYHNRIYPLSHLPGQPDPLRLRNVRTIGVLVEDRRGRKALVIVDEVLGRCRALSQEIRYEACHLTRQTDVAILGDGTMGFAIGVEDFLTRNLSLMSRNGASLQLHEERERSRACAS